MKKYFLYFVLITLTIPSFTFADDGPGPVQCNLEKVTQEEAKELLKKYGSYAENLDLDNKFRGTCKKVKASMVITIDKTLQNDYILGKHGKFGSIENLKYSEEIHSLTSSTSVEIDTSVGDSEEAGAGVVYPIEYGVFDKNYFLGAISDAFKKSNIPFTGKIPDDLYIYVLNKKEILDTLKINNIDTYLKSIYVKYLESDSAFEQRTPWGGKSYSIITFDSEKYGKYIFAPKGQVIESQYVDIEKGGLLTNKELQITFRAGKHDVIYVVVPVTSPLKSVKDYWLFTKTNGKIVLVWQKSEYTLDDSSVRVMTNTDKNMNLSLLLSSSSTKIIETPSTTTSPDSKTASTSIVQQVAQDESFVTRLFNIILSWFK